LLADANLNFPLKIKGLAELPVVKGMRSGVFGAGVAPEMSRAGLRIFRDALARLSPQFVCLRDAESISNWNRHFSGLGLPPASLGRDPGLLCAETFAIAPRPARQRPLVGVGIVHPLTINLHSPGHSLGLAEARHHWTKLLNVLVAQGLEVALFTNGPSDDERFLEEILQAMADTARSHICRLPAPKRPADLVRNIAHCDAVAAHRLHANIIAYACNIPHVGFAWDGKVNAFFKSVGRARFMLGSLQASSPHAVAALLAEGMRSPISGTEHARIIDETRSSLDACAAALTRVS
jgi:polysaccharide pyruvyl transferase WcaK-like protein